MAMLDVAAPPVQNAEMLQYIIELLGVGVGAISGALAARGRQVDLFGLLVLGIVTGLGGGTVRDVVLDLPVAWVGDPWLVVVSAGCALLTFSAARWIVRADPVLQVADAVGLAFFTMLGASRALENNAHPIVAVLMGVVTGVAGGILRDVLLGRIPLVFQREIRLYATAGLAGAVVFVALRRWMPMWDGALLVGAGVTLALRLAAIRWRLALPVFHDEKTNQS